jgi:hypothetical protein
VENRLILLKKKRFCFKNFEITSPSLTPTLIEENKTKLPDFTETI